MKKINRAILSWSLYDWANSAFATTVMAGFFPVFFAKYWSNPNNPELSTFYLGLFNSLASIVVAILAPILGAIADKGSAKKKLLIFFAFLGIIMTASLWFVGQGNWPMAVLLYVLGVIGFSGSNIFYDSLLVGVSTKENVDFVSSLGFALGYIGGGLLFLVNVLMFQIPAFFGIPDGSTAIRVSFVTVGVWWAVFSIPIMLFVKEPNREKGLPAGAAVKAGWRQLIRTFYKIKNLKYILLFLIAYWFYIDGVDTIIKMAVKYGTDLGFPDSALIVALLVVQFVAFPAALAYNWFASKIGVKRGILVAIAAYCIITILGFFMQNVGHFFILAILVGLFQGGIQALSRSFYSRLIPVNQAAEFYGFFNMWGKFATVIGPLLMGIVTKFTDNSRLGIISIIILFIIGGFLLVKVDEQQGSKMAQDL